MNQYYAHPRNAFWRIMGELFAAGAELAYADRAARLNAAGVAVWDVLARSVRPGSLDADIDLGSARANDFNGFFREYSDVRRVFFNGKKAAELFDRFDCRPFAVPLTFTTLPSTSPAFAAMPFAEKLARWRVLTHRVQSSGIVGD